MSVNKTTENGNKIITFSYNSENMFNSVSMRTTYRSRSIKDKEGEAQYDDVAMSPDERDIFNEYMEQAIFEVFAKLFKMTTGIDMSVHFDPDGEGGGSIKDNEAFNENILPAIDKKIKNALVYYVLAEWYSSIGLKDDSAESYAKYKKNYRDMNNLTFQLRKPLMR